MVISIYSIYRSRHIGTFIQKLLEKNPTTTDISFSEGLDGKCISKINDFTFALQMECPFLFCFISLFHIIHVIHIDSNIIVQTNIYHVIYIFNIYHTEKLKCQPQSKLIQCASPFHLNFEKHARGNWDNFSMQNRVVKNVLHVVFPNQ